MQSFMIAPMRRQKVAIAFGRVLREARKLKGLSQEELAADAEFDRTYPSLLERGLRTPTLTVLFQLAKVLEVSAASLVNLVPYHLYDAWITLDKGDSGMKAVPATAPANTGLDLKAFQNLGYTGEWFVFAGFVVFMWFRLLRREVEFARDAELGLVPEEEAEKESDGDAEEAAHATV